MQELFMEMKSHGDIADVDELFGEVSQGEDENEEEDSRPAPRFYDILSVEEKVKEACDWLRMVKSRFSKRMLAGLISMYGKVRLTLDQYAFMNSMMRWSGSGLSLIHI